MISILGRPHSVLIIQWQESVKPSKSEMDILVGTVNLFSRRTFLGPHTDVLLGQAVKAKSFESKKYELAFDFSPAPTIRFPLADLPF